MKKILLASTILVGTAGFAAAETANFSFSGSAYVGGGYSSIGGGTFAMEVASSFTVGMMTTTDMGLEAGASIKITAPGVSFEDDHTDGAFGTWATNGSSVSDSSVYLSGDWGKVAVAYDADGTDLTGAGTTSTHDVTVTYSNTWGDFGVSAYYTLAPTGESNGDAGMKATYSMGDYSVYGMIEWDADNVSADAAAINTADWEVTLGASASMSGFSFGGEVEFDNFVGNWDWKANAGYASGAYSVGVFAEDDGADDQIDFGANASYALGGGVSVDAAYIYDNDLNRSLAKLGVSMAF